MKRKRVLVAGGSGFLGSRFVASQPADWETFAVRCRIDEKSGAFSVDGSGALDSSDFELNGIVFFQGVPPRWSLADLTSQEIRTHFDAAVGVPIAVVQEFGSRLRKGACVVFVGSISATRGGFDPGYSAAQAAKSGLAASLRRSLPSVRVNVVTLGLVDESPVARNMSTAFREAHLVRMRTNRLVQASSVSSLIWHCLTNEDLDGAEIRLDGGALSG